MSTQKKLHKNREDKMFMGVLSGLAEYLETDVTVLRIIYVILTLCSAFFPGFILYIVMAFIMPFDDKKISSVKPSIEPIPDIIKSSLDKDTTETVTLAQKSDK